MIHTDENGWQYYDSLEEIRADGFVPIKVFSVLQFFTLAGRKIKLVKENLIPIDCNYVVLTTKPTNRYYTKQYKGYTIDDLFFYRKGIDFSGDDEGVDNLRRYVYDDRVWLLFTQNMVDDTKKMLERVCKAHVTGEATLSYKLYIQILEGSLKLEDYINYGKNLTGFRTACKIQEDAINKLWKMCLKN